MSANILAVCGFITGTAAAAAVVWGAIRWGKRITDGAKCQLRSEMLRTYYRNREAETIHQYERESFVLCYEAYRALGGNSFIEDINEVVKKWEVLP